MKNVGLYRIRRQRRSRLGRERSSTSRSRPRSARACGTANKTSWLAGRSSWATAIPGITSSNVQLRAFDVRRTGASLAFRRWLAFCSALLGKSLRGGLVAVAGLNLEAALTQCTTP